MKTRKALIILPNQLFKFSPRELEGMARTYTHIFCVEEPIFFKGPSNSFRVHKLRLAYMRATLKWYAKNVICKCTYIDFKNVDKELPEIIKNGADAIHMYDPCDINIEQKYLHLFGKEKLTFLNSKSIFIASEDDYISYMDEHKISPSTTKRVIHASFFAYVKNKLGILVDVPSTDRENRKTMPKSVGEIQTLTQRYEYLKDIYDEAKTYIDQHQQFKDHVGSTELLDYLPITHKDAKAYFKKFVKHKLVNYGAYQDAILQQDVFVYHSHCSYLLNNGLLNPMDVVRFVMARRCPMNSKEGFIRQLLGWREYMFFIYKCFHKHRPLISLDWGSSRRASQINKGWYDGSTGILPVDMEIKKLHKNAYAHHIVRLMIFLNYMKLCEITPKNIYRWFMEMVALDAYDWVMVPNIAAMGHYGETKFMHKPYLSSSQYILRMSNYKKDDWCVVWDDLFRKYIKRHSKEDGMQMYRALLN